MATVTCWEPEISQHGSVCERTTPTGKLWPLSLAGNLKYHNMVQYEREQRQQESCGCCHLPGNWNKQCLTVVYIRNTNSQKEIVVMVIGKSF